MERNKLKESSLGDLLDNPHGWTAKGGQPGDARGIVPAHVKENTPADTQEERTPEPPHLSEASEEPISDPAPESTSGDGSLADVPPAAASDSTGTPDNGTTAGPSQEPASGGTQAGAPSPTLPSDFSEEVPDPEEGREEVTDPPENPDPEAPATKVPETDSEARPASSPEEAPSIDGPEEAPEPAGITPDRSSAMERLVKQLEDRPELAETFLKMFSLMPEASRMTKVSAAGALKEKAPAPPDKADTVEVKAPADPADPDPAGSPAVPDKSGTQPEGAAEEAAPSPETTLETPAPSLEAPSPEATPETADPVPETSGSEDPDEKPEALPAESTKIARPADAETPVKDIQRSSDDVSDSSKVITPTGDEKTITDESMQTLDLSPVIDAAVRKSLRDIFASLSKKPAPDDATLSLPDSDDPLQILSAAMEPIEQARAAKAEATKVDQLLTLEQLTRSELIAMEAVLKELRTLVRRQEVHLSLNRGAVKNGLQDVRQHLADFREFLSTKSAPAGEEDDSAAGSSEVSLADLAERIDYLQTGLEQLPARSATPAESLPDAKALQASYEETMERMEHIPDALDEGIQKVLGNAQRQVDRYCTKFLSVHKKKDNPLLKALPFIAAFLGGFLGALVVGQALLH